MSGESSPQDVCGSDTENSALGNVSQTTDLKLKVDNLLYLKAQKDLVPDNKDADDETYMGKVKEYLR
jgi:hypothetical protein